MVGVTGNSAKRLCLLAATYYLFVAAQCLADVGVLAKSEAPVDCSNRVLVSSSDGILYKPSNEHGARGPTLLVQNTQERTGKRSLQVRTVTCKIIGRLGLWAVDFPYGARYYSKAKGGSADDQNSLWRKARKGGSTHLLIEGKGKWLEIPNPRKRAGAVSNG